MNTIFIDFKSKDSKEKKSINNIKKIVTNKIFKYIVNDDILNNSLSKITYIRIDREYINNQLQKGKYSIYDKILKLNINKKYGKNDVVHLIFANEFDDCKVIKESTKKGPPDLFVVCLATQKSSRNNVFPLLLLLFMCFL